MSQVNNQDINAIDEDIKQTVNKEEQKIILFCVPGRQFNSKFLLCWSELLLKCLFKR